MEQHNYSLIIQVMIKTVLFLSNMTSIVDNFSRLLDYYKGHLCLVNDECVSTRFEETLKHLPLNRLKNKEPQLVYKIVHM